MTSIATVGAMLNAAARSLGNARIPNPRLEARLLIGHGLERSVEAILAYPEHPIDRDTRATCDSLVQRRLGREPIAHILGFREFWSLPFRVTADTLVPRPETETLVEAVLERFSDKTSSLRVLDLGTGSGCLLLSILHELSSAWGLGIDRSRAALKVAQTNAISLGLADRVAFVQGDWAQGVVGMFDVIVANPPYVVDGDIESLEPEVSRFEPRLALAGGVDGLDAYRACAPHASRLLAPGGIAVFEIGADQARSVCGILRDHGLQVLEIKNDLSQIPRCLSANASKSAVTKKKLGNQEVPD
ncbi:MAG: peptide chain release factor N(5)-glutamine methyltransferase [Rhodospirillales bacterium]|nr:peptide chain release factor N(5)-glutamine methyltransferase [Rhodospirillales bacterium]